MKGSWLDQVKLVASSISELKRYWKVLIGFLSRVSNLEVEREARQIENMKRYLEIVTEQLIVMKNAGCSETEIKKLAKELNVPLIQANLEAMIIARKMNPML